LINKKLKQALLKKLNITPQALSQKIQKVKKEYPMMKEEAAYVIAHREGIDLSKFLDQKEIQNIRQLMPQNVNNFIVSNKTKQSRHSEKNITINISGEFKGTDPLLDEKLLNEAKEMAAIYPFLYVLENSIRQFICLSMEKYHGNNWWETVVKKDLRDDVRGKMDKEHINSWHQKRGAKPIDYLDMKDLPRLFSKIIKNISPSIIPDFEWINQLIKEVYISRCVLCHMNPLNKDSITSIKLRFKQWQNQVKAKISLIK